MTRVSHEIDDTNTIQKEAKFQHPVPIDVIFASSRFPNYKLGANNQVVEVKEDLKTLSMKEVIAKETAQLLEQEKRLSVRDIASKFEKGLATAVKLSDEVWFCSLVGFFSCSHFPLLALFGIATCNDFDFV